MQFVHKFYQIGMLLSFVALVASGCAGSAGKTAPAAPERSSEMLSQPRWLSEGCEAFWKDEASDPEGASRLCAVGTAAGSYSITSLRNSALRRARSDIALVLGPEVEAIIERYADSGHGHKEFGNPPDLERARNLGTLITEAVVRECEIASIWAPANNRIHVLISLDAEGFSRTVSRLPQLSDELIEELHKHAEKGLKTIKQMEEKL